MAGIESTKLSVELLPLGEEKVKKQSFGDVIANPTEENILKLGTIFHTLAPEDTTFVGVTKTEVSRYEPAQ